jgi:hypothetical protein
MTLPRGDSLTDAELRELGRVTWAAIRLEDVARSVCSFILGWPVSLRDPIGTQVDKSLARLDPVSIDPKIAEIAAWLRRAKSALKERNGLLHGIPVGVLGEVDGEPGELPGTYLQHIPRKGRLPAPIKIDAQTLSGLADRLEAAYPGWAEASMESARLAEAGALAD